MNIAAFNWIDWTLVAVIVFSTLISFARGFIREAISLITWVAAIWIAYRYKNDFAAAVLSSMEMSSIRTFISAAILFFAVLLVGALVNYFVGQFVALSALSVVDRILGMAFGLARGILLGGIFILFGEMTELDKKEWWVASQLIPEFTGVSVLLKNFVPEEMERLKTLSEPKPGSDQTAPASVLPAPTTTPSTKTAPTKTPPATNNSDQTPKTKLPGITIQVTPPA